MILSWYVKTRSKYNYDNSLVRTSNFWLDTEIWKDFNKIKILNKSFTESARAVISGPCLILDLKTNNDEAFFILSGTSFHILGPKLVIVSVPKYAVCIFLFVRCVPLLRL